MISTNPMFNPKLAQVIDEAKEINKKIKKKKKKSKLKKMKSMIEELTLQVRALTDISKK